MIESGSNSREPLQKSLSPVVFNHYVHISAPQYNCLNVPHFVHWDNEIIFTQGMETNVTAFNNMYTFVIHTNINIQLSIIHYFNQVPLKMQLSISPFV